MLCILDFRSLHLSTFIPLRGGLKRWILWSSSDVSCGVWLVCSAVLRRPAGVPGGAAAAAGVLEQQRRARLVRRARLAAAAHHLAHRGRRARHRRAQSQVHDVFKYWPEKKSQITETHLKCKKDFFYQMLEWISFINIPFETNLFDIYSDYNIYPNMLNTRNDIHEIMIYYLRYNPVFVCCVLY